MKENSRTDGTQDESAEKAFSVIDRRQAFRDETGEASETRYPSVVEELKTRAELLRKVLGVLDDLDRAITVGAGSPEAGPLLSGVTLIRDHLLQILASEGVQALDLVGKRFDPAVAEAVSVEETCEPAQDSVILSESGRGYTLGTTLLRPARVRVARFPGTESPQPQAEGDRRDAQAR